MKWLTMMQTNAPSLCSCHNHEKEFDVVRPRTFTRELRARQHYNHRRWNWIGNPRTPQARRDNIQRVAQSRILSSHATLKTSCVKASAEPSEKSSTKAILRVYLQIPHIGLEFEASDTRPAQADGTFQPQELEAYTTLSAHPTGS